MGRQADQRDHRQVNAIAIHTAEKDKRDSLREAKESAKVECLKIGPRCEKWNQRIDQLTRDLAEIKPGSVDPKADAIGKLAGLVGMDQAKAKQFVSAVDPVALPLFLELGSVLSAFPRPRRKLADNHGNSRETVGKSVETVTLEPAPYVVNPRKSFSKSEALRDIRKLKDATTQQFLAKRWNVSEPTVSKWLKAWDSTGDISRQRDGRSKQVLALAPPKR